MENFSEYFGAQKNSFRAAYLISGFIQKKLTTDEAKELDGWILKDERNMQLFEDLTDEKKMKEFIDWYAARDTESKLVAVKTRVTFKKNTATISFIRYAAAAALLGLISLSVYFIINRQPSEKFRGSIIREDVQPGKLQAILKMGDQSTIILSEDLDTVIGNLQIRDGEIVYSTGTKNEPFYHEVEIPRKGFYKLVLPDGTKVWLNSESSIRYPSVFNDQRSVSVTGETYFEVAKDPSRPFIVSVNNIRVQALGTAFNINAYANEGSLKATLIEGSVKITAVETGAVQVPYLLKPGQQLQITNEKWKQLDISETGIVTAWKDNKFRMKDAGIQEIMRQVERWYDVKVSYRDDIQYHFNGTIDRNEPVSQLLQLLESTGHVKFEVKGGVITVMR